MTLKDGFIVDVSSFCDRWCWVALADAHLRRH